MAIALKTVQLQNMIQTYSSFATEYCSKIHLIIVTCDVSTMQRKETLNSTVRRPICDLSSLHRLSIHNFIIQNTSCCALSHVFNLK